MYYQFIAVDGIRSTTRNAIENEAYIIITTGLSHVILTYDIEVLPVKFVLQPPAQFFLVYTSSNAEQELSVYKHVRF